MPIPFPLSPELSAISVAYKNGKMIADGAMPRTSPVGQQLFKYRRYRLADSFTVPETKVGRTSQPNTVDWSFEELEASTQDHALDEPLPHADCENAMAAGINLKGKATEQVTDLLILAREVRVAKVFQDPANFGRVETLSGSDRWDDPASKPQDFLLELADDQIMRANKLVLGRKAARILRTHPQILKAWNRNEGDSGAVPFAALAELLELDEVLVGEGWINIAKPGQAPNMVRVWGNSAALIHQNGMADTRTGISWGYTVPWGTRIASEIEDKDMGMRGGVRIRVGEAVKELVTAPDLGTLIQSVVA